MISYDVRESDPHIVATAKTRSTREPLRILAIIPYVRIKRDVIFSLYILYVHDMFLLYKVNNEDTK